jgi:tryptophan synthase alpha chain
MGRIEKKFSFLRANKEKALIVYLTAGDPSLEVTKQLIPALEKAGADLLEIGVPFSDPTADGPVIQAASQRALRAGTTLEGVLNMISEVRRISEIPIVLFGYYNPIYAFGVKKFARAARAAGVDAVLVVDLPPEEAHELRRHTDAADIDFISLIAPTTDQDRRKKIAAAASGFLYYISITGVTGTAAPELESIKSDVEKIRKITDLPIAVGFGISTPEQAREIACFADGLVIGSAVVRLIDKHRKRPDLIQTVSDFIREMKEALK